MIYLPGKKIEDGVIDQILLRQSLLGDTSFRKDNSSYHFFNQKMPWLKLTSSVNIDGSDLPARQNILSNGTTPGEQGSISGYRQGGGALGIRPYPGITQMQLETHNRYGSLRTATIHFKVFDVEQLDLYERLYMSPGYSLLLEWGFSKYLDENGEVKDLNQTIDLFDNKLDINDIIARIQKLRASQGFCYDAMYGIVQNFSWTLALDGSYDCSTSIVSAGYLLESMEIPVHTDRDLVERYIREKEEEEVRDIALRQAIQDQTRIPDPVTLPEDQLPVIDGTQPLPAELTFEAVNEDEQQLPVQDEVSEKQYIEELRRYNREIHTNIHAYIHFALKEAREDAKDSVSDFFNTYTSEFIENELSKRITIQDDRHKVTAAKYMVVAGDRDKGDFRQDKNYNYIQFGLLLDILNHFIIQSQTKTPLFQFDTSIIGNDQERDFKTLDKYHFSVDPSVCLLPDTDNISYPEKSRPSNVLPFDPTNALQFQRNTLNANTTSTTLRIPNKITGILLEKEYLYGLLDRFLQNGKLRIYAFVETILNDISRTTGLLNDFQIQYYQELNVHRIVDRNYIDIDPNLPRVQVFGKNSFVKNVNLTSRITPRLSTQLAIAAQANPYSNAIEGSAWSLFNQALEDRVIKEKKTPRSLELQIAENLDRDQQNLQVQKLFAEIFRYLVIVYPSKASPGLKSFTDITRYLGKIPPNIIASYREFCNWHFNQEVKGGKRNNFIIPYQLNLTLEGLSGINVMDSFVIDDFVIPRRYKGDGQVGFLVTGLRHTITPEEWTTEIISEIYNLDETKTRGANSGKPDLSRINTPKRPSLVEPSDFPFKGPTPNGDRLRIVLQQLGYTEKVLAINSPVGEITSGGDISTKMLTVAEVVFGQIKQQLPGVRINVTGGNDDYHQRKKRNSRHVKGDAIDFTITPYTNENSKTIRKIVETSGGTFLDEYQIVTQGQKGKHIHIAV